MPQLLISVKNVDETRIALEAGVDIIDLKDPQVGALGALDITTTQNIVHTIQQFVQSKSPQNPPLISATVGENHVDVASLKHAIQIRTELDIDIIKIAAPDVFQHIELFDQMNTLKAKLVAVFFAEQEIDPNLLNNLKDKFYGAMLDTQNKHKNLLENCSTPALRNFIQMCDALGLESGLAGSLKPQHVEQLADINPSYIGFRGGVCQNESRTDTIDLHKIVTIQNMLREHNKSNELAHQA